MTVDEDAVTTADEDATTAERSPDEHVARGEQRQSNDSRGVSTVVDAALCLLVIGAAVATLVYAPVLDENRGDDPAPPAGEHLVIVGGTTATVNYSLAPAARDSMESPPSNATIDALERTDHGTLAELLARSAVKSATAEDVRLSKASSEYENAVVDEVTEADRSDRNVQIEARWEPYPDAHLSGRVVAGDDPPPNVDTSVATMTVASGIDPVSEEAADAGDRDGFDGVAAVVAAAVVEGLYPPDRIAEERRSHEPLPTIADRRYERAADRYGVNARPEEHGIGGANERLAEGVESAIAADLRASFDDPGAAANATAPETVEIVVRTWSA